MQRISTLFLATLLLSSCALGPDYKRPATPVDAGFATPIGSKEEPQRDFWRAFNDAALNKLVDDALAANHDVRIAVARLQEVRASQRGVDAEWYPTIGANASASRNVNRRTQAPGDRDSRTGNAYELGFDAAWEINFFGRFSRASEAAQANTSAAEAGVQAAQVSVTGEVARNYFELRGLQRQLAVAREAVSNQEAALKLVEARLSAGRGTELDTSRARALVESSRATIPALEAALTRTSYRLAVLTGKQPNALNELLKSPQPLPSLPAVTSVGTPESLLLRRPDVRTAERQLASATARIGLTRADYFPRLTINGLLGLNSGRAGDLFDSQSFIYNIGATLVATVVDFGRIRARVAQSEAQAEGAVAQFEKTVLLALEETEGALVQFTRTAQQTERLFEAARASQQASKLARARFEAGVTDFLIVLDAERQLLADQDRLAQAQTASATSLVAIYKALGGGWTYGARETAAIGAAESANKRM